ncbi:DUF4864 domain-containing protein [Rhodobacter ferrooxidans]|uniref:DUF4864 domain-containing protein n=1 Tax=Rhodobacter ferrooxidans TaxID=371731 RepID=C8S2V2_9RHOB|nr:DUF4864 domain-containing protein [Rhodobacter sp. SW2]EEW24592.1 conserved hypothetical protein [Rhodobacter sp. SW2]
MRQSVLAVVMAMGFAGAAWSEPREADIAAVIRGQMAAFQADDLGRAFGYASPNIKSLFGSAENFGAMVQQGYPMVWRPAAVRLLGLRDVAGGLWQRVMVTDQAGASHMLDYQMIETPDGWQINAVQLLPPSDVGA